MERRSPYRSVHCNFHRRSTRHVLSSSSSSLRSRMCASAVSTDFISGSHRRRARTTRELHWSRRSQGGRSGNERLVEALLIALRDRPEQGVPNALLSLLLAPAPAPPTHIWELSMMSMYTCPLLTSPAALPGERFQGSLANLSLKEAALCVSGPTLPGRRIWLSPATSCSF
jgi:hypothetical protein